MTHPILVEDSAPAATLQNEKMMKGPVFPFYESISLEALLLLKTTEQRRRRREQQRVLFLIQFRFLYFHLLLFCFCFSCLFSQRLGVCVLVKESVWPNEMR
ncbi:hypothetical protein CDAR_391341 [Caerostris darwini]|uniref:Transmembrane protein n=1 Tax=Caerostris darwini TaxID=1538125 RepID=A0AAV4W8U5_9ARAC|nr:hypothetical protein CDAR_391341 [Caerostris darwini]